jgi:peroxiredoxin
VNIAGRLQLGLLALLLAAGSGCDPGSGEPGAAGSLAKNPVSVPIQQRGGPTVGTAAPNFQLYDLDGNPVTLASHRGKVVLINFWATWCGPCRVEMPGMQRLYQEFGRKDFEILAISTDQQGPAVTRPFRNSLGLSFPILHDSDYRVGVTYGARTLPMSFLVDRQGIIIHRIFGARDWQSAEGKQLIANMIGRRPDPQRPRMD